MHTATTPRRAQRRLAPVDLAARPSGSDRVGDRDRSVVASTLGRALSAGYLDVLEYEERLEQALGARTGADLGRLTADLPAGVVRDPERVRRAARAAVRIHAAVALAGVLVCCVVWLAVGLGGSTWYPWPVWPALGGGLCVAAHAAVWRVVLGPARLARRTVGCTMGA